MLAALFLNSVLASAGFFTMGILFSWPATALPSIREISYSIVQKNESIIQGVTRLSSELGGTVMGGISCQCWGPCCLGLLQKTLDPGTQDI